MHGRAQWCTGPKGLGNPAAGYQGFRNSSSAVTAPTATVGLSGHQLSSKHTPSAPSSRPNTCPPHHRPSPTTIHCTPQPQPLLNPQQGLPSRHLSCGLRLDNKQDKPTSPAPPFLHQHLPPSCRRIRLPSNHGALQELVGRRHELGRRCPGDGMLPFLYPFLEPSSSSVASSTDARVSRTTQA